MECEWCAKGDKPAMLDQNGVLCKISGESGQLAHSYGDDWWPCGQATRKRFLAERRYVNTADYAFEQLKESLLRDGQPP